MLFFFINICIIFFWEVEIFEKTKMDYENNNDVTKKFDLDE